MVNVCYIISDIHSSHNMEWVLSELSGKLNLSVILLNKDSRSCRMKDILDKNSIKFIEIIYSNKFTLVSSVLKVMFFLRSSKVQVVHCHLFEASLVGLVAAKLIGIKKRIHTRHNATIHHDFYPSAVKYDRFINFLSTKIIAVSSNVRKILIEMEGVDSSKIEVIRHGYKWDAFEQVSKESIEGIRVKYNISPESYPVVGVISRYIEWKGIQYIIPAFVKILKEYPRAKLILANADGPYKSEIKKQLENLPADSYIEIEFEDNIYSLYKLFHVYVHAPIDRNCEAFGQTYIEALALGIPSVFTISGIADDLVKNGENALVANYKDSETVYECISAILQDEVLKAHLTKNGLSMVKQDFDLKRMIRQLEYLYTN